MSPLNFRRLAREAADSTAGLIDPRDIFTALPSRAPGYDYLRGPQDQVLASWFETRHRRDLTVKLNTGGGKSIVGLLIARSSINEGVGPAAYLAPDHYLAEQVRIEATQLGIETTDDPRSIAYSSGRAILVDVFQRVYNGQSIFGVAGSAGRPPQVPIKTVVIDDAHACLAKAEQASRLRISRSEQAFSDLLKVFRDVLDQQSPSGLLDIDEGRFNALQQVPYWAWSSHQAEVLQALHPLSNREPYLFSWPLLVDVLPICRAIFTGEALEIAPPCLPVDSLLGLHRAVRRIYLTATLADDSILVTDFAADPASVAEPIVPANAGDIGDRLILVPQQTHPKAEPDAIRDLVVSLASERNVVVIVPSFARARYWEPFAQLVLDKDNLTDGVARLCAEPGLGLVVLVNRYDGVDLPGDACHVLVIDGLPEPIEGLERIDQSQLIDSTALLSRQVQRLEQGMGRATRSNEDYCVVMLLGARLAERLYTPEARQNLSPATRAELELSESVATDLEGSPLSTLKEVIEQCLGRDEDWITVSRAVLATLRYAPATVSATAIATRQAFDLAAAHEYRQAVAAQQRAVDTADGSTSGYLLQQLAVYLHQVDPPGAQQTQLAANRMNRAMLRPMEGVAYERLAVPTGEQAAAASSWLQTRYTTATDLIVGFAALTNDLDWGTQAQAFERSWSSLAWHLGFAGQQPEREIGRGPDGLWALPGGTFLVCEAKNGAQADHPVYKRDAEQLSNAMDWFRETYLGLDVTPVMIHPREGFDTKAAVPTGCRVVNVAKLMGLRTALRQLAAGLADTDAFRDTRRTSALLAASGLTAGAFLTQHTVSARRTG